VRGELQLVQVVDEDVVGCLQLLVAEIPLCRPGELAAAQRAALRHPRRPEVQAACQERGVQVLLQVGHPRRRAGGVRELPREPGPLLDLGEQVGDVDPRREPIELGAQPDRGWGLVERFRWRQLEVIADERDTVAGVDCDLKGPERVLLIGLELTQTLGGVKRAAECHGELVTIGVPAFGGHEEPGGVGVAAPDGPVQAPGPQRVARDEPQPELIACALHTPVVVEHPPPPGLRQHFDRLVDEPVSYTQQTLPTKA
jgi:hypothetical protein